MPLCLNYISSSWLPLNMNLCLTCISSHWLPQNMCLCLNYISSNWLPLNMCLRLTCISSNLLAQNMGLCLNYISSNWLPLNMHLRLTQRWAHVLVLRSRVPALLRSCHFRNSGARERKFYTGTRERGTWKNRNIKFWYSGDPIFQRGSNPAR